MRRLIATVVCALGFISAALVGALTGLETVFLDPARYTRIQDALNIYEDVGVSRAEQMLINADLAAYLAGQTDSLAREVTLRGRRVSCAFNARELEHMADVRRLFDRGRALRAWLIAITAAAALTLSALGDRRAFGRGLSAALIVLSAAGATAILLLRTADFNRLFLRFHQLVFTNDLWLLNPDTDAMIRMLPTGFFSRMARAGALGALSGAALPLALGAVVDHMLGRKK